MNLSREELDVMWTRAMQEAGMVPHRPFTLAHLRDFAALVAAAEREACAQICEHGVNAEHYPTLTEVAAAIRARGQA
jgi:hypothetical protein